MGKDPEEEDSGHLQDQLIDAGVSPCPTKGAGSSSSGYTPLEPRRESEVFSYLSASSVR